MTNINSKLLIVCPTCNAFFDMVENNYKCLEKYWPNHPNVIYISDFIEHKFSSHICIRDFEGNYSDRLLQFLHTIESKYVLFVLDDYYLCKNVDEQRVLYLLDFMENQDASYVKLYKSNLGKWFDKKNKIRILNFERPYEVSMVPSLWRRIDLIKILEKNKNPWQTEVLMTKNCKKLNMRCFCCSDKNVYRYADIVRKGKYLRDGLRFIKRNNLYISRRTKMPIFGVTKINIRTFISSHLPYSLVKFLSKTFKIKRYSKDFDD